MYTGYLCTCVLLRVCRKVATILTCLCLAQVRGWGFCGQDSACIIPSLEAVLLLPVTLLISGTAGFEPLSLPQSACSFSHIPQSPQKRGASPQFGFNTSSRPWAGGWNFICLLQFALRQWVFLFPEEHFDHRPELSLPLRLSVHEAAHMMGSLQRAVVTKAEEFLWMLRGFFIVSFFPARILWR